MIFYYLFTNTKIKKAVHWNDRYNAINKDPLHTFYAYTMAFDS